MKQSRTITKFSPKKTSFSALCNCYFQSISNAYSINFYLTIIATHLLFLSGSAYAQAINPTLEWSWTSSANQPFSLNVMMTPSVIDLNGDDIPEVIFGSTSSTGGGLIEVGVLRVLNGANGQELFTIDDPDFTVNTAASIAVGDIDEDGLPEIIACDSSGRRLIAFENDGTFKWRSPILETIHWGAISIANLDNSGPPELVIGRQALSNTGQILWTGTGGKGSQLAPGSPLSAVSDLDLDGFPEIIAGNTVYSNEGAIVWQAPLPDGYPAIGNFDGDEQAEVILVTGGNVYLLDDDGDVLWGPALIPGGGRGGPPTIGDYDSDGEPEIGVAGGSRYAVFETDGSLKWQSVTQDGSSNVTGSSVFDFNGDGAAEVVYSDELTLRVYQGNDGMILFETPLSSCTWHEYPLVVDVDGDDEAEIVAVANNNCGLGSQRGIFVYGSSMDDWVLTRRLWNQHTYHITNINPDGTIPLVEQNNWQQPGLNNFRLNAFGSNEGPRCDIDTNGQVNRLDIRLILKSRNVPAVVGDARDFDENGTINVLDARGCALLCDHPSCMIGDMGISKTDK